MPVRLWRTVRNQLGYRHVGYQQHAIGKRHQQPGKAFRVLRNDRLTHELSR